MLQEQLFCDCDQLFAPRGELTRPRVAGTAGAIMS